MGFSLFWAAVRGKSLDAVLSDLELERTGRTDSCADWPFVAAELPGEWHLILIQRGQDYLQSPWMDRLSGGGEVVACFVEEHVMYSAASGWRNGSQTWKVEHDAQQGI